MKNRQKLYDRVASLVIRLGGVGLILTVLGIFVFMVAQTLPLFLGATIQERANLNFLQTGKVLYLGIEEWGQRPFVWNDQGELLVYFGEKPERAPEKFQAYPEHPQLKPRAWDPASQTALLASPGGEVALITLNWKRVFSPKKPSQVSVSLHKSLVWSIDENLGPPFALQVGEDTAVVMGTLQDGEQGSEPKQKLFGLKLGKDGGLSEEAAWKVVDRFQLDIHKKLQHLILNPDQDTLLLGLANGEVQYWQSQGTTFAYQDSFYPFGDPSSCTGTACRAPTSMNFLHGGNAVYLTSNTGENTVWSLLILEGSQERQWVQIQDFPNLPKKEIDPTIPSKSLNSFAKSLRNRAFLVSSGPYASLRHSTTGAIRWEQDFDADIIATALSEKYHRMALLDQQNQLHLFELNDPHPEGGLRAFFGKLWYEGGAKPTYQWQSTGGSDAFEPKLSMIPLIIGTLKGTLYSLLFAVPLALLAALYTSEFLHPRWKHLVKPLMEIMASLPSVILGFLAALWLAPRLETAIPSLILIILGFPLVSLLAALSFNFFGKLFPQIHSIKFPLLRSEKYEWMWLMPILLLTAVAAWYWGPAFERWAFVVTDPSTGAQVADFREWWRSLGSSFAGSYEMRNAMVVGIVMGIAVIPLIFTLAEEAFSAVPKGLRSASLALGANHWQTAIRVVLPTATIGVFSAIMIGLGRAVGETMIVLMATGNTPLLDFNPFTGMRTLSANLAVELPEAPFQGTLYRTLFLGAVLLFIFTFGVNSIAEILRERIRKKSGG